MRGLTLVVALLLAACGAPEAPPPEKPAEGRAETRSIRNTETVGYDGAAVADQVDEALDANERRIRETEQATDE